MADKGKKDPKGVPAAAASKPGAKAPKPAAAAAPAKAAAVPPPSPSRPAIDPLGVTGELKAPRAHGFRRKLVGRVTSDKMNKTVTVEVIRNSRDPVYKKIIRVRERYKAHDETNQFKIGDHVEITEFRPISRHKRWMVTKLVRRTAQE
jgi:small subunit ribosomal protein S17